MNILKLFLGLIALQKLVHIKSSRQYSNEYLEIWAILPVDWVGLPPDISITKSFGNNFLIL